MIFTQTPPEIDPEKGYFVTEIAVVFNKTI